MITKGYVTYSGNNVFGKKTLYSFRVGTEDKFFGTGEQNPNLEKNDYIKFDYSSANGRFYVDPGSIEHIAREEPVANPSSGSNSNVVQRGAQKGDGYWGERLSRDIENDVYRKANDLRIQYQSARNAAIAVVDVLLRERTLKLADGPKVDNVAVVMGKIDDLTEQFFKRCGEVGLSSVVNSGTSGDKLDNSGSSVSEEIPWK